MTGAVEVERSAADAGVDGIERVLLPMAPLFILASSTSGVASAFARGLMVLALCYAVVRRRAALASRSVFLCVAGMVAVGLLRVDFGRFSTWTALVQALLLLAVAGTHKVVRLDHQLRARVGLSLLALAMIAAVVTAFVSVSPDFEDTFALGPFGNPNALGMAALAVGMLCFRLASGADAPTFRTWMRGAFLACLAMIVASGSRTALGAMMVFLLAVWVGRSARHGRAVLRLAAVGALLAIPLITIGYTWYLLQPDSGAEEVEIGHKQVMSGRNIIWPLVIVRVAESPVVGHGLGRTPGDELPEHYEGLSAHNGFLQVLFQGGFVGLAFYLGLLVVLFRRALSLADSASRAAAVGALCAAILAELFEVLLTQNHFGIGIVLWTVATTSFVGGGESPEPAREGADPGMAVVQAAPAVCPTEP